jgi:hypothetical protein
MSKMGGSGAADCPCINSVPMLVSEVLAAAISTALIST